VNTIRKGGWGKLVLIASILLMLSGCANAVYSVEYAPLEDTYVRCTTNPGWTLRAGNLTTLLIGNITNIPVARAYLKYSVNESRIYTLTCADNNGFNTLIPVPTLYYLPTSGGEFFESNTTFVNQPCNSSCTMAGNTLAGMRYALNGCPTLESIGDMGHGKFTYGGNDYNNFTRNVHLDAHVTTQFVLAWQDGNHAPWYSNSIYSKESTIPMPCTLSIAGCQYPTDCAGVEGGEYCNQNENYCDVNNVEVFNHTLINLYGEYCYGVYYRNLSVINASGEDGGTGLISYLYHMGENDTEYQYVASEPYPMETQPYGLMYDCGISNTTGYKYYVEVRDNSTFNYQLGQSNEYIIQPTTLNNSKVLIGYVYYAWTNNTSPYALVKLKNIQTGQELATTAWVNGLYMITIPQSYQEGDNFMITGVPTEPFMTGYRGYSTFGFVGRSLAQVDVRVFPFGTKYWNYTGKVVYNGVGVNDADVLLSSPSIGYATKTNASGDFNIPNVLEGVYNGKAKATINSIQLLDTHSNMQMAANKYDIYSLSGATNITLNVTVFKNATSYLQGAAVTVMVCPTWDDYGYGSMEECFKHSCGCERKSSGITDVNGNLMFYQLPQESHYLVVSEKTSYETAYEDVITGNLNIIPVYLYMPLTSNSVLSIKAVNKDNTSQGIDGVFIEFSGMLSNGNYFTRSGVTVNGGYMNTTGSPSITSYFIRASDMTVPNRYEDATKTVGFRVGISVVDTIQMLSTTPLVSFNISGTVLEAGVSPIPYLTLVLDCHIGSQLIGDYYSWTDRTTTHSDGTYLFTNERGYASCTLSTATDDYINKQNSFILNESKTINFNLTDVHLGTYKLAGIVYEVGDTNKRIEGATVRYGGLGNSSVYFGVLTTPVDGTFSVDLPPGLYSLFVSKDGYQFYNTSISLLQSSQTHVYIPLTPTPMYWLRGHVVNRTIDVYGNFIEPYVSAKVYLARGTTIVAIIDTNPTAIGEFQYKLPYNTYTLWAVGGGKLSPDVIWELKADTAYSDITLVLSEYYSTTTTTFAPVHPPGQEYSDAEMISWLRVNIFPMFQLLFMFFILSALVKFGR
jgi:hypothetical protein